MGTENMDAKVAAQAEARPSAREWLDEHWQEHPFTAKWSTRNKMNRDDQESLPALLEAFRAASLSLQPPPIGKLRALAGQWQKQAQAAIPSDYSGRGLSHKYLKLDNYASGIDDCAMELLDLLDTEPAQRVCEACGGSGRELVSREMAIDAGQPDRAGTSEACRFCGGNGWFYEVMDGAASLSSQVQPEREPRPKIICLCGSTKFRSAFEDASRKFGLQGVIVLSVSMFGHSGDLSPEQCTDGHPTKTALDELHKRKIDLADEVFVLNVGGYIGTSTRSEIIYATKIGKPVRYLEAEARTASHPPVEEPEK